MLTLTGEKTSIKVLDVKNKKAELEDIPLYREEDTGDELYLFSDLIKADERRIAKKYGISEYNIFELALLYADVKQRKKAIRQKFRFNKMLFYIEKKFEEEYGEDSFLFDEMGAARAGPIPVHLGEDIKDLNEKKYIEIYLVRDGKKISGSKENWEKFKHTASIECILTRKGHRLAKEIWEELDIRMKEIIVEVKEDLMYIDTELLMQKVHDEYPEYRKNYTENDKETFEEFLM
ncbi:MAG: hypothetical protein KJI71_00110 [Patescibacteria group bacterium]|nr:hypothetical protein [Patescibacteria group bacterium]